MTKNEQPHDEMDGSVGLPDVIPLLDEIKAIEHTSEVGEDGIKEAVEISREWLRTATNLVDLAVGKLDVNNLSSTDFEELKVLANGISPQQLDDLCSRAGANHVREVFGIFSPETPA